MPPRRVRHESLVSAVVRRDQEERSVGLDALVPSLNRGDGARVIVVTHSVQVVPVGGEASIVI